MGPFDVMLWALAVLVVVIVVTLIVAVVIGVARTIKPKRSKPEGDTPIYRGRADR